MTAKRAKTTPRAALRVLGLMAGWALLAAAAPALAQSYGHHGGYGGGYSHGGGYGHGGGYPHGGVAGGYSHGGPVQHGPPGRGGPVGSPGGGWNGGARYGGGYPGGSPWYYTGPSRGPYPAPAYRGGGPNGQFRRGAFLPPNFQGYVLDDYWRYHLRRPPYGYQWVQAGNQYLLVSTSTGIVFDVVTGF